MFNLKRQFLAVSLLACSLLAGCGGGGGSSTTTTTSTATAEGVYGGTLSGSTSTAFEALVLENGDIWSLYGTQTASVFSVAGFIQGAGTSNNGSFTSSTTKDFGFAPAVAGSLNASYDATAKTIAGTFSAGGQTATFTGGPIAGSLYDYTAPASLTTVAGPWSTTSATGETITIDVAANGALTAATSSGCNFTGTVTPRPSGKNVFNVSLTFGVAPCALAGQTATGIALAYPLAGGLTQLLVAVVDGTRSYGALAFGTR